MNISIKNPSTTKIELTITLSSDELASAKKSTLENLRKDLKVSGFRQGKVPADIAEKHLDTNLVANETLATAVNVAVPKAFVENKVKALGVPEVSIIKYVPDESAEFKATVDILPEVKLGSYKKLKAKREKVVAGEKEINEVLKNIQTSFAEKKTVKRAAKRGDEVQIDFTGKKDGVVFEGGTAKDFKLALGSGQFIPGFEDGVIGHEVGDKFNLDLSFPKDYHVKDLAGAKVVFEVLLKQVNENVLPELSDDLAKKCGPFKTLVELKADVKKNLEEQGKHKSEEKFKDDLVAELVKGSTVDAPEILIDDQLKAIRAEFEQNLKTRGMTPEAYFASSGQSEEAWKEEAKTVAKKRVEAQMVLVALSEELKISATDKEADAKVAELKDIYKNNADAVKNLSDERVKADIKNRLTIEKTIDKLVEMNA
jgi:trigger factor